MQYTVYSILYIYKIYTHNKLYSNKYVNTNTFFHTLFYTLYIMICEILYISCMYTNTHTTHTTTNEFARPSPYSKICCMYILYTELYCTVY